MPAIVNLPRKINLDKAILSMPPEEMIDALNVSTMSVGGAKAEIGQNIAGNRLGDSSYVLPSGDNYVIGKKKNSAYNSVYYAVWNSNGDHRIVRFDATSNICSTVFQSDKLSFNRYSFVDIEIVNSATREEFIILTDNINTPFYINISRAINGEYSALDKKYLASIKVPPVFEPSIEMVVDSNFKANSVYNKAFQFAYRYIYKDSEISVYSPISEIALDENVYNYPVGDKSIYLLTANRIDVTCYNGSSIVETVEIIAREGNTGNWHMVHRAANDPNTSQFTFQFYNNGNYDVVPEAETNGNYDLVPLRAPAISYAENRIIYAGPTLGYNDIDLDIQLTPRYTSYEETRSLQEINSVQLLGTADVPVSFSIDITNLTFLAGDVITVDYSAIYSEGYFYTSGTTVSGTEYTEPFSGHVQYIVNPLDTIDDIGNALQVAIDALIVSASYEVTYDNTSNVLLFSATTASGPTDFFGVGGNATLLRNSLDSTSTGHTFKADATHPFGIVYYNEFLQDGGLQRNDSMNIAVKGYSERLDEQYGAVFMDYKINHIPPVWAHYWSFAYAGNTTTRETLSTAVLGAYKTNTDAKTLYLSLRGFKGKDESYLEQYAAFVDYEFVEGDRMRIIKKWDDTLGSYVFLKQKIDVRVISLEYLERNSETNPIYNSSTSDTINQTTGYFLIIENPDAVGYGWDDVDAATDEWNSTQSVVIEIYRPYKSPETIPYFEVGGLQPVINAGESTRRHAVQSTANYVVDSVQYGLDDLIYLFITKEGYFSIIDYSVGDIITVDGQTGTWEIVAIKNGKKSLEAKITVRQVSGAYAFIGGETIRLDTSVSASGRIYCGDAYFRMRLMPVNNTTPLEFESTFIEDFGFSDFIPQSRQTCKGRVHFYNSHNKQNTYNNSLFVTENYSQFNSFNGLCTIRSVNTQYKDYTDSYGNIRRLLVDGQRIFMIYDTRVAVIGLNKNIIETASGDNMITLSKDLLSDAQSYIGEFGINNCYEAVGLIDGHLYIHDPSRGKYVRYTNEGAFPISEYGVETVSRSIYDTRANIINSRIYRSNVGFIPNDGEAYFGLTGCVATRVQSTSRGLCPVYVPELEILNETDAQFPIPYVIADIPSTAQDISDIVSRGYLLVSQIDWYENAENISFDLSFTCATGGVVFAATYSKTTGMVTFSHVHETANTMVVNDAITIASNGVIFKYGENAWTSRFDFDYFEGFSDIGQAMVSFLSGQICVHDQNADGTRCKFIELVDGSPTLVTHSHSYTFPVVDIPVSVKLFQDVSTHSSAPFSAELLTNLAATSWADTDFELKEGVYYKDTLFDTSTNSTAHVIAIGYAPLPSVGPPYDVTPVNWSARGKGLYVGDKVYVEGTHVATIDSLPNGDIFVTFEIGETISLGDFMYVQRPQITSGDPIRGSWLSLKLTNSSANLVTLFSAMTTYEISNYHHIRQLRNGN